MGRAPKKCGSLDCDERVVARTYCAEHQAEYERRRAQKRGTTTARGYGSAHQRARARWTGKVQAGSVTCWRCGEPIKPDEAWDLGHSDHDRNITRGPEHAHRCNRAAAGRTGAASPPPPGAAD